MVASVWGYGLVAGNVTGSGASCKDGVQRAGVKGLLRGSAVEMRQLPRRGPPSYEITVSGPILLLIHFVTS